MIKKFLCAIAVLLAVGAFSSSLSAAGVGKYDSFPGGWNMPFSGTALFYQGYGGKCWSIAGKPPTHVGKDYYAIDLSGGGASRNSKVYAPASGYVKFADWDKNKTWYFGNQVIVEAGATGETGAKKNNRYIYRVAHLNTLTPKAGWWVNKGDVLGTVGNTGNSIDTNGGGNHIHFAVHRGSYASYGLISGDSFPPSWPPGIDGFDNKVKCIGDVISEFQPPLY